MSNCTSLSLSDPRFLAALASASSACPSDGVDQRASIIQPGFLCIANHTAGSDIIATKCGNAQQMHALLMEQGGALICRDRGPQFGLYCVLGTADAAMKACQSGHWSVWPDQQNPGYG